MVYDSNIKATYDSLVIQEKEAYNNTLDISKCVVVVFSNKNNIKKKEIKTNIAKEWTKAKGYFFYESSPKSRNKVNDAFKKLFEKKFQKTIENISKYIY